MKYALYMLSNGAVIQWQDTEMYNYNEPESWQGRITLSDPFPAAFDVFAMPSGYWVIDGELTQVAPPPTILELGASLMNAVLAKKAAILDAIEYPGGGPVRMSELTIAQLLPIALSPEQFPGLSSVDFQEGSPQVWRSLSLADLKTTIIAYITARELCSTNVRAHQSAITALVAAADRPGLVAYDVNTGWPTP